MFIRLLIVLFSIPSVLALAAYYAFGPIIYWVLLGGCFADRIVEVEKQIVSVVRWISNKT